MSRLTSSVAVTPTAFLRQNVPVFGPIRRKYLANPNGSTAADDASHVPGRRIVATLPYRQAVEMTPQDLVRDVCSPIGYDHLTSQPAGSPIVVDLRGDPQLPAPDGFADALLLVPRIFVAVGPDDRPPPGTLAAALDVVVADAADILDAAAGNPIAATALAVLLRGGARSIADGLVAESTVYSALQAGPEHGGWLASRTRRPIPAEEGAAVRVERDGDRLLLTLARPHRHNAFDARTREELLAGLAVAAADPSISEVVLAGDGPSFCSGGDLDEFGTRADPASAHLLRIGRSAGAAIASVAERVVAHVHGTCIGAGVELPAFAGRVVADPATTFRLPEVAMGLVPGAGGTVSLPRRVGRHRTALMALTGRTIDATTAHAWGLVDAIDPRS